MVKFIVGKADLNISAAIRSELVSLLENGCEKRNIVFIVPDQFEYETEKTVYRILDEHGLLTKFYEIRVTTFSRLCREILEECGEHRPFADDIVKNIIMHKTVSEQKGELSALNKVAARPGFCGRMVKTISALKTSGITACDLELSLKAIADTDKSLSPEQPIMKKLFETNTLYTNYEALLSGYVDKLDVTAMAADYIASGKSGAFDGADVLVDCFNDFTQSQIHFMKCVIRKAESVTFGFTSQLNSDCDVFRTANGHIERLREFALNDGLNVEFVTENIESRFANNSSLSGLSKHIFQNAKNRDGLGDSCELISARGVYGELDYVAAKIKELTLDKGMRYGEIAVLCTDVGAYGKYVESVFKKYEIPIFLDCPEPILYQPLINLVISILNALESFSIDTVMSCVKTGFFAKPKSAVIDPVELEENDEELLDDPEDSKSEQLSLFDMFGETDVLPGNTAPTRKDQYITLSDKDIDQFESYIYEWDLKPKHLKKPFAFKDKHDENDLAQETAECVRKAVAEPLLELQKRLQKQGKAINGAKITELLYDFLINKVGMRRAIFKRCKNEQNTALDADKVAHYQRLWNSLVDIMDKLHAELSETNVTIGEYRDIFREICAATTLANPPQLIDSVLVGDIDRTRADNIRAAFVVGTSDEAFPTPSAEAGIFSQYEIELIFDKIVHIEGASDGSAAQHIETLSHIGDNNRREYCLKSAKEQYYLSLYRAYRAVTLPTEYLCISCPDTDDSGESLSRSEVFGEIASTFKNTKIKDADSMDNGFYCRTLKAAKMRYAMRLNDDRANDTALRRVIENEDGEFVKALDEIRELRKEKLYEKDAKDFSGKHTLKPATARLLFSNVMGTTAVEKLNVCKFKFFCEYGLKIDERNKRSFTKTKRGESIHYVFQKVLEEYSGDMNAFFALKRSELLSLSKKYLAEYRERETNNDPLEDKRTEYLFNNLANSAADVLITIQTELFARRYRPKFFELKIKSSETERHAVIDNESEPTVSLPETEIFSDDIQTPEAPTPPEFDKNAPYLITAPLEITLSDDSVITVQGIIDRVDMFGDGTTEDGKNIAYIRVVDYKSSAHAFDLNNAQNGINIQMLLYLFALQSANENNPTLELRPGGVSYIPSKNNGASETETEPFRLLAMNYHENGLFIKDDVTESDLKNYNDFIFRKFDEDSSITPEELADIKSSFEPKEFNQADAKLFNKLRDDIIGKVTENLDALFGGTIDALPTVYSEKTIKPDNKKDSKVKDVCEFCRFKEICRNGGKNVHKIEKAVLKPKNPKKDDKRVFWENKYIAKETKDND